VTAGIYCTISPPLSGAIGRLFHSPGPAAVNDSVIMWQVLQLN